MFANQNVSNHAAKLYTMFLIRK